MATVCSIFLCFKKFFCALRSSQRRCSLVYLVKIILRTGSSLFELYSKKIFFTQWVKTKFPFPLNVLSPIPSTKIPVPVDQIPFSHPYFRPIPVPFYPFRAGISIVEIFLETNFFKMLFFLLRPLRNSNGILLCSRARLDRLVARFLR